MYNKHIKKRTQYSGDRQEDVPVDHFGELEDYIGVTIPESLVEMFKSVFRVDYAFYLL